MKETSSRSKKGISLVSAKDLLNGDDITLGISALSPQILERKLQELAQNKKALELLIKKEQVNTHFFQLNSLGSVITDNQGLFITTNYAFKALTGYQKNEVDKLNIERFFGEDNKEVYEQAIIATTINGSWAHQITLTKLSGEVFEAKITLNAVFSEHKMVSNFMLSIADITQELNSAKMVKHLAQYDQLTELPNRYLLNDRLSQHIKLAKRDKAKIAVMFMDLDNFKTLNDTQGHVAGDELLIQVAERMRLVFRQSDTISRFGGDEFIVIVNALGSDHAENNKHEDIKKLSHNLARKLLESINKPYAIKGQNYHTTFSIGISLYPDDATTEEELIQNADVAMYKAKANGKNSISFYDTELKNNIKFENNLEQELQQALQKSEFRLYYQPQVDLHSQKIISAEALIRWMHPTRGLLTPDKFLQSAENLNLMSQIDDWVIEESCQQLALWRELNIDVKPISINLTHHQFTNHSELTDQIKNTLNKYKLPSKHLKIEVIETGLMKDIHSAMSVLSDLSNRGIEIALDDFGTGYSSLTYLRRFPINILKIDKSFIDNIVTDRNDQVLVKAIMAMSKDMDIKILAEGIETEAQRAYLISIGCQLGQGYLFAKPQSAYQFQKKFLSIKAII